MIHRNLSEAHDALSQALALLRSVTSTAQTGQVEFPDEERVQLVALERGLDVLTEGVRRRALPRKYRLRMSSGAEKELPSTLTPLWRDVPLTGEEYYVPADTYCGNSLRRTRVDLLVGRRVWVSDTNPDVGHGTIECVPETTPSERTLP